MQSPFRFTQTAIVLTACKKFQKNYVMKGPIHSALLTSKPPDQAKTVWLNAPKMLSQSHGSYSPGSL